MELLQDILKDAASNAISGFVGFLGALVWSSLFKKNLSEKAVLF